MITIHKYAIDWYKATIRVQGFRKVLTVQPQNERAKLWCEADTEDLSETVIETRIIGTGDEVPAQFEYVTTYQDGPFVWHVYYKKA